MLGLRGWEELDRACERCSLGFELQRGLKLFGSPKSETGSDQTKNSEPKKRQSDYIMNPNSRLLAHSPVVVINYVNHFAIYLIPPF